MKRLWLGVVLSCALSTGSVAADNWTIHMTVDNEFSAWFGNSMQTTLFVGSGNWWPTTYTFNVTGANPTDYFYVATASDHMVAQGFIGEFNNVTQGYQFLTGLSWNWEVFPAGRYLQQLFGMTSPWPASVMPTQAQIDAAIAYATTFGLWIPPTSFPGYVNGVSPWGFRSGISANAQWIWHRDPNGPANPMTPGYNHEEFLVFRVAGVPAPLTVMPLAAMGVLGMRRRRHAS